MQILDKHFKKLSLQKKIFLLIVSLGYIFIAIVGFKFNLTNLVESLLIFVIGVIYTELIRLNYRIQDLEGKKQISKKTNKK